MMGHCLDLQEEPQNLEQILSDCKETLKYCVKTGKTPVESFFVKAKRWITSNEIQEDFRLFCLK